METPKSQNGIEEAPTPAFDADAIEAAEKSEEEKLSPVEKQFYDKWKANFSVKYEIWKSKDLAELAVAQDQKLQELFAQHVEQMEKDKKPLTKEEITTLLSQEYTEFPITIADTKTKKTYSFVLRELPQSAEEKFYNFFKAKVKDHASDLQALSQEGIDADMLQQVEAVLSAVSGMFDVLPAAVAIILDYANDNSELSITADWVSEHISSHRQWSICRAQLEANRLRDFFSNVFQDGKKTKQALMPHSILR